MYKNAYIIRFPRYLTFFFVVLLFQVSAQKHARQRTLYFRSKQLHILDDTMYLYYSG